jgi:IMP dehydrogenase/GMP reductase
MLGGMLAGHDQSGGEIIEKDGKKKKLFYGMSSATAMTKHKGGVAEYRFVKKTILTHYLAQRRLNASLKLNPTF